MRARVVSPLELDARQKIYQTLSAAPGLHFRELQRRTKMAVGELQYHLDFLEKEALVKKQKDHKFVHYYALQVVRKPHEERLLPLLRQRRIRRILVMLLTKKRRQIDLAEALSVSPATISLYATRLSDMGVIGRDADGHCFVHDPQTVRDLLISYRASFLDPFLDRFIEAWLLMGKNE